MSIPIDRLYHYLNDLVNHDVIIYRWLPHGSKKLEDLSPLKNNLNCFKRASTPIAVFHDQEPLNYYLYSENDFVQYGRHVMEPDWDNKAWLKYWTLISHPMAFNHCYEKADLNVFFYYQFYDHRILVHSEVNSKDVDLYRDNNFIPVYYWSHGIIARDWFRYAEYDCALKKKTLSVNNVDFLIYNRAWSGSREYRLYWTQELINNNLTPHCKTSFNPCDSGTHYTNHQFVNNNFQISRFDLEEILPLNTAPATASADYETEDYLTSNIEVVLETLFDTNKIQLTEKTLRPIACGHPFILVGPPGSLKYLRNYQFKTFDGIIDESYDLETDHKKRLELILLELKRIANLPTIDKQQLLDKLHSIAQYNKEHFFSNAFHHQIESEFVKGFDQAFNELSLIGPTFKNWNRIQKFVTKFIPNEYNKVFLVDERGVDEHQAAHQWLADYRSKTPSHVSSGGNST